MGIQLRCPNEACAKLLFIRDDLAGKTGKCPSCGTTLLIPAAGPAKDTVRAGESGEPVLVYPDKPGRFPMEDDEIAADRPRRRRMVEDEEDDQPAESPLVGTKTCLWIGIGLLAFLSFVPLFSMYSVQNYEPTSGRGDAGPPVIGGMINLPEGKIILIGSAVAATLCLASFIFVAALPERVANYFLTFSSSLAIAWGLTLACWFVGLIWDMFALTDYLQNENNFDKPPGPMTPGLGIWLGLGAALVLLCVFAILLAMRGRAVWFFLASGLGLAAGIFVVVFLVRPWDTGPNLTPGARFKEPLLILDTKFGKRYWPLNSTFGKVKEKLEQYNNLRKPQRQ
jgi:hypothetical protein